MTQAHYLRMASRLGIGAVEAMRMRPGLLYDQWALLGEENEREE